jgi:hypothetical protein
MTSFGNNCYCYNEECNQKEWEKQGKEGKREYTVVTDIFTKWDKKIPRCPYCKKKMTITANMEDF